MAWSTRELAELAGTSVRAVRHYHEVGLLAEPQRRANGWKQYGVAHLVRLLRIKRLTDLGVSLPQIAAMGDEDEHPAGALRTLDAELAATIERLQRARVEIGAILRQVAPTDMPIEFAPAATQLSDQSRAMATVMSRVLGPRALQAYSAELLREDSDPTGAEFESLPADADEPTREDLARRLVPVVRAVYGRHPGLQDFYADAPRGSHFALRTVGKATASLTNTAQIDVLRRVNHLLQDARPDPR